MCAPQTFRLVSYKVMPANFFSLSWHEIQNIMHRTISAILKSHTHNSHDRPTSTRQQSSAKSHHIESAYCHCKYEVLTKIYLDSQIYSFLFLIIDYNIAM